MSTRQIAVAIKQRRSVRQYTQRIPGDKDLQRILSAGIWAPSGLNNQPWKFKVVRDKAQRNALAKFTKYASVIRSAPMAICVFLDNGATYNREKDILAVGACIQNMLLQAYALGLGSCWLGEILNNRVQVEKFLRVGCNYELLAVITVGYSDKKTTKGWRKAWKSFILD